MLDNIVQGIRYFVKFCLTFNRHNYVVVTSCSSFVKNLNCYIYIYLFILSFWFFQNSLSLQILCQAFAQRLFLDVISSFKQSFRIPFGTKVSKCCNCLSILIILAVRFFFL